MFEVPCVCMLPLVCQCHCETFIRVECVVNMHFLKYAIPVLLSFVVTAREAKIKMTVMHSYCFKGQGKGR